MGPKIGKISPIRKQIAPEFKQTIAGSLSEHNINRWPGSAERMIIQKDRHNKYITGLDVNAEYIKLMSPQEAEQERTRINSWRAFLKESIGFDAELEPRGSYYMDMMKHYGKPNAHLHSVQPYLMKDGVNIFNLEDPYELITYCWLRVHPFVAPSYQAYELGNVINEVRYFVDDEEYEASVSHKSKVTINKAISKNDELTPSDRRKVAKLLGLPVSINSTEEMVYNIVDSFLKESINKNGAALTNVNKFNTIMSYQQANLNIRYMVKLALEFNLYRKAGEAIFEGQVKKASSEEELINYLTDPTNSMELSLLEDKIKEVNAKELL